MSSVHFQPLKTIIRQPTGYQEGQPQERVIVIKASPWYELHEQEPRVSLQISLASKSQGVTLTKQNALDLATALTFYAEGLHNVR